MGLGSFPNPTSPPASKEKAGELQSNTAFSGAKPSPLPLDPSHPPAGGNATKTEGVVLTLKGADLDRNGKVTVVELFTFLLKHPLMIALAVVIVSFNPLFGFIKDGLTSGVWNYGAIVDTAANGAIGVLFYLGFKTSDREYYGVIEHLRSVWQGRSVAYENEVKELQNQNRELTQQYHDVAVKYYASQSEIQFLKEQIAFYKETRK